MDLLRLVLCQQPLDRILHFPRVANSKLWQIRTGVLLHEETEDPDIFYRFGELSVNSWKMIDVKKLQARACFLRNEAAFSHYYNVTKTVTDFWLALATGMEGIQEIALNYLEIVAKNTGNHHATAILRCRDLNSIPWTSPLRSRMLKILRGSPILASDHKQLISYLQEYPENPREYDLIFYSVESLIGGRTTVERREDVDKLLSNVPLFPANIKGIIRSGYIPTILELNFQKIFSKDGYTYVRIPLMVDSTTEIGEQVPINRSTILRAEAALLSGLPIPPWFRDDYLVMCGVDIDDHSRARTRTRVRVGLQNASSAATTVEETRIYDESPSLHGLVLYDPVRQLPYTTHRFHGLVATEIYRRGLGDHH